MDRRKFFKGRKVTISDGVKSLSGREITNRHGIIEGFDGYGVGVRVSCGKYYGVRPEDIIFTK